MSVCFLEVSHKILFSFLDFCRILWGLGYQLRTGGSTVILFYFENLEKNTAFCFSVFITG